MRAGCPTVCEGPSAAVVIRARSQLRSTGTRRASPLRKPETVHRPWHFDLAQDHVHLDVVTSADTDVAVGQRELLFTVVWGILWRWYNLRIEGHRESGEFSCLLFDARELNGGQL